jgi:hypothetical protein
MDILPSHKQGANTMTDTAYIVVREDRMMTDLIVDSGSYTEVTEVADYLKDHATGVSEIWQTLLTVATFNNNYDNGGVGEVRTCKLTRSDRKLIRQDPDAAAQRFGMDLVVYMAKDNSYTAHLAQPAAKKEAA